jgi:hypothetical protein
MQERMEYHVDFQYVLGKYRDIYHPLTSVCSKLKVPFFETLFLYAR